MDVTQTDNNNAGNAKVRFRPPTRGRDVAGYLTQLLFGTIGIAIICWCGWCSGKLTTDSASSIIAICGMLLAVNYGFKSIRYFRRQHPDPLPPGVKMAGILFWGGLILGLFNLMQGAHQLLVVLSLIVVLYVFFIHIAILQVFTRPGMVALVILNAAIGLAGWGLAGLIAFALLWRYTALGVPCIGPYFILESIMNAVGPNGAVILASVLILAAYLFRLEFCHRLSGEPRSDIFKVIPTWIGLTVFCGSLIYCGVTYRQVNRDMDQLLPKMEEQLQRKLTDKVTIPQSEQNELLQQIDTQTRRWNLAFDEVHNTVPGGDVYRYCRIERFALKDNEDAQALTTARKKLQELLTPLYPEWDRLTAEVLKSGRGSAVYAPRAAFSTRLVLALIDGNAKEAQSAWKTLTALCQYALDNAFFPEVCFKNSLKVWVEATNLYLESPLATDADLALAEEVLFDRVEAALRKPSLSAIAQEVHKNFFLLEEIRSNAAVPPRPAFNELRSTIPLLNMWSQAEKVALLRYFENVRAWQEMPKGVLPAAVIVRRRLELYQIEWQNLTMWQSKLRSLRILVAARRYSRAKGAAPDTLPQLVPEYLKAIPTDPLAPEAPYTFVADEHGTRVISGYNRDQVDFKK